MPTQTPPRSPGRAGVAAPHGATGARHASCRCHRRGPARPLRRARPLRLAHRGAWGAALENSLPALLAANAIPGCDGVEVDVREASDGTPILLHDATLSRVHRREERADRLSPGDLAALGVPTLAGALAAVSRASFVNVEMKGDFGSAVVEVLEEHRGANPARTVISSFSPAALDRVRSARPGWRLWLNVEQLTAGSIRVARELGSVGVSAGWPSIDREVVDLARQAGLHVAAWTVTDSVAFERLSEVGVDAICAEANALWP